MRRSAIRCSTNFTSHSWLMEVEKLTNVHVEHPVHLLRDDPDVKRVQRVMLASPRAESVREAEKVRLVDLVEHFYGGTLDYLVFQRRYPERPHPTVRLRNEDSSYGLCSVRSAFQACGEILEVLFQLLSVFPPRLPVHSRCSIPLEAEVGPPERVQVVHVVHERREPYLLVPPCDFAYPLQRARHADPVLCPGHVLLRQIPFGQPPSLHPLRGRLPLFDGRFRLALGCLPGFPVRARLGFTLASRFVRCLRCSGASQVLRGCVTSRDRSSADCVLGLPAAALELHRLRGGHRISRFSRKVLPYMLGVFDHAGPAIPRHRGNGWCCLLRETTASAPGTSCFRGSIPGLHVPLSTLQARPCGRAHMTRGRCGRLPLQRPALSSAAPCRFIPARQFHHIQPYAKRGPATLANISLRCRRHNQYEAELVFGPHATGPRIPVTPRVLSSSGERAGVPSVLSGREGTHGNGRASP